MSKTKKVLTALLALSIIMPYTLAIEDNTNTQNKKPLFSWFRKSNNTNKKVKSKKVRVEEIKLPPVTESRPKVPFHQLQAMTIDDCVEYAINHNPNLKVSNERVKAAKAGIGEARANYAPRLTGRVSYNHNTNHGSRLMNTQDNSIGFNVGVSETIWDFGRTTARINMAKYDTMSAEYDHSWEELNIIYDVKTDYYRVLMSLADLDIYEQNVRIQTLNYERTKAMFDEGLKSKIDVVNAEVNLTDAKIQLVEGQNNLQTNIIALKNSMYYQEDLPFVVENTENFSFLKADYRKKIESTVNIKPSDQPVKKTQDGLIMLSSGIEHNDIIQNFEFKPYTISKEEAVKQALELRPDLKSNEMLVNVQEESLKAIKRQYMPEIAGDLTWGYTKSESSYSSPLQVGASVGIGSLNPYGIHYQVKEGESYLDIALHNLNIAKSDIYWEVQQNYVNMRQ
ncbi:TolC family protein, partial [bacterium]|nr:TolC family protein [bacterium]